MSDLNTAQKLYRNANAIRRATGELWPKYESSPSHYDKRGFGFNEDERFAACSSIKVRLDTWTGVYGNSGCSTFLSLDADLFGPAFVKALNKHRDLLLEETAKNLMEMANKLKAKAQEEIDKMQSMIDKIDAEVAAEAHPCQ